MTPDDRPHRDDRPRVIAFPEDRLPPQNIEVEEAVIGACLLDPGVIDDVFAILSPEDFWRSNHQIVARVIRDLRDAGKPVDALTVDEELRRLGLAEEIGGPEAISDFANRVAHAANARHHAAIVQQKAQAREVIRVCRETIDAGYGNQVSADALLESGESGLFAIRNRGRIGTDPRPLSEAMVEARDRVRVRSEGGFVGLRTGYQDFDDETGGLQPGSLTIVAARPGMGKTMWLANVADFVGRSEPVLFISLEMDRLELGERVIAARSGVFADKLRKGDLGEARDRDRVDRAVAEGASSRMLIDDGPMQTASRVIANARRMKARTGLALVALDYLQLLTPENGSGESRQEMVAAMSRRLKLGAKELGVPVVAAAQLNRLNEQREDKRPRLSDLRESGAIEQDADLVLMLHRPEYYDPNDSPGLAEVLIQKHRNGRVGKILLAYESGLMRFSNFCPVDDPVNGGPF
jgi:replicative DNA helicase